MADEESVFSGSKCDLPPVTPVPTEHMLVDPTVPDPPNDIPDCADAPLDELPPDPPCPPLAVGTAEIAIIPADEQPYVNFTIVRGPNCDYDFSLDIGIPEGCPDINPATPTTKPVAFATTTAQMAYSFTKDPETCTFDFDLDFDVPCPPITPITPTTKSVSFGSGSLSFGFTKGPDCDYDLDVDIDVPCPPLTPTTLTNVPVTFGTGNLAYRFVAGLGCSYDLEMEIDAPCPAIGPTVPATVPITFDDDDLGELTYEFEPDVDCTFFLNISEIKAPCPTLEPAWTTPEEKQVDLDVNDTPYGELRYGFEYSAGCVWTLNIELTTGCMPILPLAETTFTDITYGETGYGFQYHIEVNPTSCQKTFTLDAFKLPCIPTPNVTVDVTELPPGSPPTVDITVDTDADCLQEWYFDVQIAAGNQGDQGHQGNDGEQGLQGPQGFQGEPGDKMAIVPYRNKYIGLACTEMPEPRFEEVITVVMPNFCFRHEVPIDDRFLAIVEQETLEVVGIGPNQPVRAGARIVGDKLVVQTDGHVAVDVVVRVKISAIRLGHNWRFKEFTARQARANLKFWDSWKPQGLLSSSF